jgi:hypothetical protein
VNTAPGPPNLYVTNQSRRTLGLSNSVSPAERKITEHPRAGEGTAISHFIPTGGLVGPIPPSLRLGGLAAPRVTLPTPTSTIQTGFPRYLHLWTTFSSDSVSRPPLHHQHLDPLDGLYRFLHWSSEPGVVNNSLYHLNAFRYVTTNFDVFLVAWNVC